jgi:hypothetical protein
MDSDGMLSPDLLWRRFYGQRAVMQIRQYTERDIGREQSERLEHDSHHRVSSRLLSWGRGGEAKPRDCAVSDHLLELSFRDSEAIRC